MIFIDSKSQFEAMSKLILPLRVPLIGRPLVIRHRLHTILGDGQSKSRHKP